MGYEIVLIILMDLAVGMIEIVPALEFECQIREKSFLTYVTARLAMIHLEKSQIENRLESLLLSGQALYLPLERKICLELAVLLVESQSPVVELCWHSLSILWLSRFSRLLRNLPCIAKETYVASRLYILGEWYQSPYQA
jgi:hypothetical protein